jgi:hypothetical protein
MANELQTQLPVYLPKSKREESAEDYDTSVSHNENALNQNFNTLFSGYADLLSAYNNLLARIKILEGI